MDDKLDAILASLESLKMVQSAMSQGMDRLRTHVTEEIDRLRTHVMEEIDEVRTDLRVDIIATRSEIMERLDRQQSRLEAMFADIGVNWHSAERVERKVEADRDEIRLLVATVSELTRGLRMLETRLANLEDKS